MFCHVNGIKQLGLCVFPSDRLHWVKIINFLVLTFWSRKVFSCNYVIHHKEYSTKILLMENKSRSSLVDRQRDRLHDR